MKSTLSLALLLAAAATGTAAITTDWNQDYTGSEAHTLALFKFDSPTPLKDASDHIADGTLNANAAVTPDGGKFGGGLEVPTFSTKNDNNVRFNASAFSTSAISVEFWFRPLIDGAVSSGSAYLFDKKYTTNTGMELSIWNSGLLIFTVGNGDISSSLRSDKSGVNLTWNSDQWYHIAATFENVNGNGVLSLYRDGTLLSTNTVAGFGDLSNNTRDWVIGNRSGPSYSSAAGYYDNFRVSDVAYQYAPIPEPTFGWALLPLGAWLLARTRKKGASAL